MELDQATYEQSVEPMQSHTNVGFGSDVTIKELASTIAKVTGYTGQIAFDSSKADGAPRKLMDSSTLNRLGWIPQYDLGEGLFLTYKNFKEELAKDGNL